MTLPAVGGSHADTAAHSIRVRRVIHVSTGHMLHGLVTTSTYTNQTPNAIKSCPINVGVTDCHGVQRVVIKPSKTILISWYGCENSSKIAVESGIRCPEGLARFLTHIGQSNKKQRRKSTYCEPPGAHVVHDALTFCRSLLQWYV